MTKLFLCRHGEPANAAQANALGEALREIPLAAVYTSPLARAVETAASIADVHQLVPIEIGDLREIELGEVDGLEFDAFPAELQAALLRDPLRVRFPGGETYHELQERICRSIDSLVSAHDGATIAVVTHAGPIRAALAAWLGIADQAIFRVDQRYAAVNVVEWIDGVPLVRLVNGAGPAG